MRQEIESTLSLNQQWRPLPSLLCVSFFFGMMSLVCAGLAPFKNVFWSSSRNPGNRLYYDCMDVNNRHGREGGFIAVTTVYSTVYCYIMRAKKCMLLTPLRTKKLELFNYKERQAMNYFLFVSEYSSSLYCIWDFYILCTGNPAAPGGSLLNLGDFCERSIATNLLRFSPILTNQPTLSPD